MIISLLLSELSTYLVYDSCHDCSPVGCCLLPAFPYCGPFLASIHWAVSTLYRMLLSPGWVTPLPPGYAAGK